MELLRLLECEAAASPVERPPRATASLVVVRHGARVGMTCEWGRKVSCTGRVAAFMSHGKEADGQCRR